MFSLLVQRYALLAMIKSADGFHNHVNALEAL